MLGRVLGRQRPSSPLIPAQAFPAVGRASASSISRNSRPARRTTSVSGAIPLAVWRPGGHGEASPPSDHCRLALFVARAGPLLSGCRPRPRPAVEAGRGARRSHGGGPMRGDAVTDLPLIKAAKLWAKVSQRTGATYLTGRWGGCRVLVFENLERASEAEPSHFLFLGEAGEWPVPDQATAPTVAAEPAQGLRSYRPLLPPWSRTGRGRSPCGGAGRRAGTGRPSRRRKPGRPGSGARAGTARSTGDPRRRSPCRGSRRRAVHRGPARRHRAGVR